MAVFIGVIGGLLGAAWNGLNASLTKLRLRWIHTSNCRKMVEVCLWSLIISFVAYSSMFMVEDCKELKADEENKFTVQLTCPDGQFHALGAMCKEAIFINKLKLLY